MQRLRERRLSRWRRDYLTHRALWPALQRAVTQAIAAQPPGTPLRAVDLGCGERPYADWLGAAWCIGIDRSRDGASPDVLADACRLPLPDGWAHVVLCSQVIEHVRDPDALVAEAARVLAPGGHLVLSGPSWWPLHEQPHDYWRFTVHGFAELLRRHRLQALQIEPDTGAVTVAAVALIEALPRWALALVPVVNTITPWLQARSANRLSTLNCVVLARKPHA